jgi:hypothetical protein
MARYFGPKKYYTIRQIAEMLGPWQHCWVEVQRKSGVKLISQLLNYEETFRPWDPPKEGESISAEFLLGAHDQQLISTASATDLLSLQRTVIIVNGNQFLLRDNPTKAEFEKILSDYIRWKIKPEPHLAGGKAARQLVRSKAVEVVKTARTRFKQLAAN